MSCKNAIHKVKFSSQMGGWRTCSKFFRLERLTIWLFWSITRTISGSVNIQLIFQTGNCDINMTLPTGNAKSWKALTCSWLARQRLARENYLWLKQENRKPPSGDENKFRYTKLSLIFGKLQKRPWPILPISLFTVLSRLRRKRPLCVLNISLVL